MSEQTFRDKYYEALETQISHLKTINELTEKIDLLQKECDLKGQQLEELHKRIELQARHPHSPAIPHKSPEQSQKLAIKCSMCKNDVDDELKADPFFTGVYKCQDCRKPKPYDSPPKNSPSKLNSPANTFNSPANTFNSPANIFNSPANTFNSPPKVFNSPPKVFNSPPKVQDSPLKSFHSPSSAYESQASPVQKLEKMAESAVPDTSVPIQVTATPAPIQTTAPTPARNETISQYELCLGCSQLFAQGSWAPKGTQMCKKCFRAQTGNKGIMNRTCNQCNAQTTSKWYSDRHNIGAHICKSCYSKRRTQEKMREKCNQCKTDLSIRWYLDSFDIRRRLCVDCFEDRKKPKLCAQ
ncbi:hypothetical protein HDV06_001607 [Boothiomyces sp. JEL0866]|nr:hypothetical protein HDV06_001607 [Boothiomyces sp. JEL0866]